MVNEVYSCVISSSLGGTYPIPAIPANPRNGEIPGGSPRPRRGARGIPRAARGGAMGHEGGGRERGARGEVSLQNSFHGARHKVAKMAVRVEGRLADNVIRTGRIRRVMTLF